MNEFLLIGFVLLLVVAATIVMVERNRNFLIAYVIVSFVAILFILVSAPLLGILALVGWGIALRYLIRIYNTLITLNQNVEVALHDVTTALIRRESVVPKVESYVAGYSRHERDALLNTIRARGGRGENLFALVEAYPALRASETFMRVIHELVSSENAILDARLRYNESVRAYNGLLQQFPTVLFARAMAFADREYITH